MNRFVLLSLCCVSSTSAAAQKVVIGDVNGLDENTFGWIADVGADSLGRIVVIDNYQPEPRAYAADGSYLGPLGRSGQGPGEFLGPSAVGVSPEGRVAVVDGRNGRVTLLTFGKESPQTEGSFRPDRPLSDICWIGSRLFGLSTYDTHGSLLVEYSTDGEVVREFGERIIPTGPLAAIYGSEPPSTLNQGSLDCDEGSETVAYASLRSGIVRLYSADGELRWSTTPPGWTMIRIRRTRDGDCCRFGTPEGGYYHHTRGLMIDDDHVVVSTELVGVEGSETYVLRRSDGGFLQLTSGEPFYHARLADGRRVGHRHLPFGQVVIGRD